MFDTLGKSEGRGATAPRSDSTASAVSDRLDDDVVFGVILDQPLALLHGRRLLIASAALFVSNLIVVICLAADKAPVQTVVANMIVGFLVFVVIYVMLRLRWRSWIITAGIDSLLHLIWNFVNMGIVLSGTPTTGLAIGGALMGINTVPLLLIGWDLYKMWDPEVIPFFNNAPATT